MQDFVADAGYPGRPVLLLQNGIDATVFQPEPPDPELAADVMKPGVPVVMLAAVVWFIAHDPAGVSQALFDMLRY